MICKYYIIAIFTGRRGRERLQYNNTKYNSKCPAWSHKGGSRFSKHKPTRLGFGYYNNGARSIGHHYRSHRGREYKVG